MLDIMTAVLDNSGVAGQALRNRLKVARAERSLSQDQLAQKVGVTRQTISSIETGAYCPSALLAFRLAETLGEPVDRLFFLEGEPS
jgi:putative transcriptional regulator